MSIQKLISIWEIEESALRTIVNEFKLLKEAKFETNEENQTSCMIADGHIIVAKKFIKDKSTKKITVDKLRQHPNNSLELNKVSRTGVYILLKKGMGYSYK